MAANRGVSLGVVVVLLVALGAVLFYSINQLSSEIPGRAIAAQTANAGVLHAAAERGDLAAIDAELKRGVKVDQSYDALTGREGITPLMAACAAGRSEAVRALLAAGAQANARSSDGKTALIYAAGWGTPDTVQALLDRDARVDDRTEERWTALMWAAGRGHIDSLRKLLLANADVNARNKWGQTPLMAAARAGDPAKVAALLEAGAAIDAPDLDGMTALNTAAGDEGGLGVLQAILAAKSNPNLADSEGVTPLMRSADLGDRDKVMLLLDAGADAKAADKSGRTAAEWAKNRDDDAGRAVAALLEEAGG